MCSVGTFVNLGKFSGELLHKLIESDASWLASGVDVRSVWNIASAHTSPANSRWAMLGHSVTLTARCCGSQPSSGDADWCCSAWLPASALWSRAVRSAGLVLLPSRSWSSRRSRRPPPRPTRRSRGHGESGAFPGIGLHCSSVTTVLGHCSCWSACFRKARLARSRARRSAGNFDVLSWWTGQIVEQTRWSSLVLPSTSWERSSPGESSQMRSSAPSAVPTIAAVGLSGSLRWSFGFSATSAPSWSWHFRRIVRKPRGRGLGRSGRCETCSWLISRDWPREIDHSRWLQQIFWNFGSVRSCWQVFWLWYVVLFGLINCWMSLCRWKNSLLARVVVEPVHLNQGETNPCWWAAKETTCWAFWKTTHGSRCQPWHTKLSARCWTRETEWIPAQQQLSIANRE